jgi:glycosyltransferase involved in cell wall biosynthesis
MAQPLITIGITLYNKEQYVENVLKTVLSQTYSKIEILIVDDKSTDNSLELVKQMAERYESIRVIEHQENGGLSVARNTIIDNAMGEYLLLWDADDLLNSDAVEKLVGTAVTDDALITLGFIERGETWVNSDSYHALFTWIGELELHNVSLLNYPEFIKYFSANEFLMNIDFIRKNKLYYVPGRFIEDSEARLRFLAYAGNRISAVPVKLGKYLKNDNSLSRMMKHEKIEHAFLNIEDVQCLMKKKEFVEYKDVADLMILSLFGLACLIGRARNKNFRFFMRAFENREKNLQELFSNMEVSVFLQYMSMVEPDGRYIALAALVLSTGGTDEFVKIVRKDFNSKEFYLGVLLKNKFNPYKNLIVDALPNRNDSKQENDRIKINGVVKSKLSQLNQGIRLDSQIKRAVKKIMRVLLFFSK